MRHDPPRDWQGPGCRSRPAGDESGLSKCWSIDGTKKVAPTGVDRKISSVEGDERGLNEQDERQQKRHTAQGCWSQEGPGEQVEGEKKTIAYTGDGGRRKWTPVQVDN